MAWFFRLNTLPNTTQFSTFYYFLLQYSFSSSDICYLLLIFNYLFLFILNHMHLLSPRFSHFILLNFIASSSTLLHLRFAFLFIRNFYVFYQYQCGSASSQVESQISQYNFFLAVQVLLFFFFCFLLRFFGLQNANLFWF